MPSPFCHSLPFPSEPSLTKLRSSPSLSRRQKESFHTFITDKGFYSRAYPVETQDFLFYATNLSFGTPPQPFRTVVDINWTDLSLPSSTCGSASPRRCSPSDATCNASASSTYHDNRTITQIAYGPVYGYARLSEDALTFADGLQVPGQVFHEIKYYEIGYDFGAGLFDGGLELTVEKPWPHRH